MPNENTTNIDILKELETKSVDILNWLETSIKGTADFVQEQTPQFIQELLTWNFYESLLSFIMALLMFSVCGKILWEIIIKNFYAFTKEEDPNDAWPIIKRILVSVLLAVCFISGMCNVNIDWLKIKVAPRVYLLEYSLKSLKTR